MRFVLPIGFFACIDTTTEDFITSADEFGNLLQGKVARAVDWKGARVRILQTHQEE